MYNIPESLTSCYLYKKQANKCYTIYFHYSSNSLKHEQVAYAGSLKLINSLLFPKLKKEYIYVNLSQVQSVFQQAAVSPLQGFFNCVVYGWQRQGFKQALSEETKSLTSTNIPTYSTYNF